MIVYATGKLHPFYLLVPLLLISLFMMVYDGGSKYLLLLATICDSVPAGLEKTVCSSLNGSGSTWGKPEMQKELCWTSKVDQWIPLQGLIELISQCRLNQLATYKYWCML